jgi:broad specificity phosphatase PhoE
LAERTKKIHFIRHAEGYHNVATKTTGSNECLKRGNCSAGEHALWDAKLTPYGIEQGEELREYLATRPSGGRSFTAFDLVVVSPLTRTLQTAEAIFGPPRTPGVPAFLDPGQAPEGSPESEIATTRAVPRPRILVREECRERWGLYVCDGRRPIREIVKEFPGFDFSELQYDEDCFYTDEREPDEHCCERAVQFLDWLNQRPEKCIAVVTHSSFLRHLFQQFGKDHALDDQDTLQRLAGNCELRSIVLCSHGVKERHSLKPMTPKGPASTVDLGEIKLTKSKQEKT